MTIRKGEDWGSRVPRPANLITLQCDADANQYLSVNTDLKEAPSLSILDSNLARALGLKGASATSEIMLHTLFDAILTNFTLENGETVSRYFLGHALLRNNWFRGRIFGAFNTSFQKNFDWAPKSHPNDSKVDFVSVDQDMRLRDRVAMYRLLKSGTHLPHPKIEYRQATEHVVQIVEPTDLYIDGVHSGRVISCDFRALPDAVNLYW